MNTCEYGRRCEKADCRKSHHCISKKCKGRDCLYVHPCKFGKNCNTKRCTYSHPCKKGLFCLNFISFRPCENLHDLDEANEEHILLKTNMARIAKNEKQKNNKKYQQLVDCFTGECSHYDISNRDMIVCIIANSEYVKELIEEFKIEFISI